jgi:hypothetical protein
MLPHGALIGSRYRRVASTSPRLRSISYRGDDPEPSDPDDDCNDMHCSRNGTPINCCGGNRHGDNDRQMRVAALPSQKAPFLVGSWQCW